MQPEHQGIALIFSETSSFRTGHLKAGRRFLFAEEAPSGYPPEISVV
jgi:hypothetical protein